MRELSRQKTSTEGFLVTVRTRDLENIFTEPNNSWSEPHVVTKLGGRYYRFELIPENRIEIDNHYVSRNHSEFNIHPSYKDRMNFLSFT